MDTYKKKSAGKWGGGGGRREKKFWMVAEEKKNQALRNERGPLGNPVLGWSGRGVGAGFMGS